LHYAGLIITNLIPNLNIQPKNPDGTRNDAYLSKRLFPIHFLETLLFQHHHDVTGLYGDSVIKLWTQIRKENKGIEAVTQAVLPGQKIVPKDTFTKLAAILGQHALTDDLKTRWIQAVEQLDLTGKPMQEIFEIQKLTDQISSLQKRIDVLGKHANEKNNEFKKALQHDLNRIQLELGARSLSDADKQKAKFYQMLISLGKLDILELWLHTSFAQDQNISNLTNEVDNSKDFLDTLLDYKKTPPRCKSCRL
jgi:DNA-binding transcriptional regulator/RsmH inhibitor MraZ